MRFEELDDYKKDLKQLRKKFRTLDDDLDVIKKVLEIYPDARPPFSFRLPETGNDPCIIKWKKIACRSLKEDGANSGLRLIYAWMQHEQKIVFLELYHKNEKLDENRARLKKLR